MTMQCLSMVQCCFTSTETQDGHLDFHTAPELWSELVCGLFGRYKAPTVNQSTIIFFHRSPCGVKAAVVPPRPVETSPRAAGDSLSMEASCPSDCPTARPSSTSSVNATPPTQPWARRSVTRRPTSPRCTTPKGGHQWCRW